jgi:hypothetical protein
MPQAPDPKQQAWLIPAAAPAIFRPVNQRMQVQINLLGAPASVNRRLT